MVQAIRCIAWQQRSRHRPKEGTCLFRTPVGGGDVATLGTSVAKGLIMTTRRSIASLATTATAALALTSAASTFPDKLLQFVTPYTFGGSHALHASIITTAAEPHFGQPMISVIRTGGGGVVGADYVLKSAADGHVMLFGDPNLNSLRPQVEQLSFSVGDFIPVARINYSPWVFVAKPDAPFGGTALDCCYANRPLNPFRWAQISDLIACVAKSC